MCLEIAPNPDQRPLTQAEKNKKKKVKRKLRMAEKKTLMRLKTTGRTEKSDRSVGWGRLRRHGIAKWYTSKSANRLLTLTTKYKNRFDWSHKEVLRMAHPRIGKKGAKTGDDEAKDLVLTHALYGFKKVQQIIEKRNRENKPIPPEMEQIYMHMQTLDEVMKMQSGQDDQKICQMIRDNAFDKDGGRDQFTIVREHIPTGFFNTPKVFLSHIEPCKRLGSLKVKLICL